MIRPTPTTILIYTLFPYTPVVRVGLNIEKNPVFAPAGQKMQFDAQPLESQVGTPQRSIFGWRQYFGMRNFAPGAAQPGSLRQPQDNLQVAQTARRFLAIRLQGRSEEHTSELQSLMRHSSAVFCLKK